MRHVVVNQWGETPHSEETEDLPPPPPDSNLMQLTLKAAGLHNLVRSRAQGTHYSAKMLPHTLGVDGVGTSEDGYDYYFSTLVPLPGASLGSYSEKVNVLKSTAVALPPGADAVQIAGLLNPGMSSWMALTKRTSNLPRDFTCVILGVTSTSGRVAVSLAKVLGAGTIIGVSRNKEGMDAIPGIDVRVTYAKDDQAATDFSQIPKDGVDVVLDYVYGPATPALFRHLTPTPARPLQYVQVGSMGGKETMFPSELLRGKDITMRGTGPGAWSGPQLSEEMPRLVQQLAKLEKFPLKVVKMADVAEGWTSSERVVFTPGSEERVAVPS